MTVEEMERRFYELKGRLDVGAITEEQFKSEIEKLRFQDAQNRWWMIGAQSGKWYTFDGARWIPGQPPAETPPLSQPPPQPSPAISPAPVSTSLPAAEEKRIEATPLTPGAIASRPAPITPRPERLRRAPTPLKLPASGPAILGCAALAAIILVIVFWFAVENFVPGKPISSFLWGLTGGGNPSAALMPTRPAGQPAMPDNDVTSLIAVGDQFVLQSQFDTAIAQYTAAAQIAPSSPVPLTRWSRALALRGQIQDALAKAQQATQRGPNDADASAQLARVLAWSGQTEAAIAVGEKAIQLDPRNANARAFLSEAYLLARRAADAQTQAQAALQLAPQSAEAHRAQAWVLTLAGQKDAARVEWKQTVSLEPNLFFRHHELAEVERLYFNAPADAVAEYQKAIALYGAYIPAYSRLGLAFLDLNQPQDAIAQFQRAITLDPNNADGFAYLGLAFQKANQCEQAIPYFEQSLKIDANNSVAQKGLSDCQSGKTPSAPAPAAPPGVPLVPPTLVPPSGALPAPVPPTATPGASSYPSGQILFPVHDANANTLALFRASAADGGGRTKISADASSASIRPDGALLIFTQWNPGRRSIWTMGIDGSNRQQLTERNEHTLASFSPDGSAFVFASRAGQSSKILLGDAMKMNQDDGLQVLGDGQSPTWGPSNRIAYKPCARGGCGIALMNPAGSGTTPLANFADATVPAWSPDGSKIAVGARTTADAWNIFLVDVAGGSVLQLTNQLATDGPAAFSPDGKSLAFLSSRNNTWAIWIMNAAGANLRKAFDLGGAPAPPGQVWWEQRIVWVK